MQPVVAGGADTGRRREAKSPAGATHGVLAVTVDYGPDDSVPHDRDLLAGSWGLLGGLGAVPRRLIWDRGTGVV